MHIAICFFGLTRSLHITLESIKKNIFEVLQNNKITFTTYLHTYNLKILTNVRSGENSCILDAEEYKMLNCHYTQITDQEMFLKNITLEEFTTHGDPFHDNFKSIKNLLCQLNSLQIVTNMWKVSTEKYDLVLYLRPDLLYNKLNVRDIYTAQHLQCILTPPYHTFGGINDRFAVGPPQLMYYYGSRQWFARNYAKKNKLHSESFLKYVIQICNLRCKNVFQNYRIGR